jgi:hypothetical protein
MTTEKRKRKHKMKAIILILGLIIGALIYVNNWNSPGDDFDFEAMILEADIDMVSIAQEDPLTISLLEKYKPRLYVAKDSYKPMDFYADYVVNSSLKQEGEETVLIKELASKDDLLTFKNDKSYFIDYQGDYKTLLTADQSLESIERPYYGRAYKSNLVAGDKSMPLVFLKYNMAYPYSGLPDSSSWWKKLGADVIGNPLTWHELDIHGAIHIVLNGDSYEPLGVILAQHNHHRVFLKDLDFTWPEDNQVEIVIAKYSNEPYMMTDGKSRLERAIGNPFDIAYLFGLSNREPITGGYDYVPSIEESLIVEGKIVQLPFDDPLYVSVLGLGDRPSILGYSTWFMSGPPGIDFYAMSDLLDLSNTFAFWYINPEDEKFVELFNNTEFDFMSMDIGPLLDYQKVQMVEALEGIVSGE